jgi:shikimate dehydrogenase
MEISGRTKILGIFGYPVEHTLSPAMHNAALQSLGLDYCYVPFSVHPDLLEKAVNAIRALNLKGVNITVPHKEKVMSFLDRIDEEASFIGAVNTIFNNEGTLVGYNTDGRGFMQSLAENGISVEGSDILVIGAGGAARAIGYYLCKKKGGLHIYGRNREKVDRLVNDLKRINENVSTAQDTAGIKKFQIIINTTPLGLNENDQLPFDTELLTSGQTVCDLIYRKTRLIREASKKGCITIDGAGMLLWQGVFAFEIWTGKKPDVEVMRTALRINATP